MRRPLQAVRVVHIASDGTVAGDSHLAEWAAWAIQIAQGFGVSHVEIELSENSEASSKLDHAGHEKKILGFIVNAMMEPGKVRGAAKHQGGKRIHCDTCIKKQL